MIITSFFTNNSIPALGLTPTINIWYVTGVTQTLIINAATMTQVGDGFYQYDFTGYDNTKDYVFRTDGVSLPPAERYQSGSIQVSTLTTETLADIGSEVWDAVGTSHTASGSFGEIVQQVKANTTSISLSVMSVQAIVQSLLQIETGRTRIDTTNNTLTVFGPDCTTPLIVFNLRDENGVPSVTDVCERRPATVSPALAGEGVTVCP